MNDDLEQKVDQIVETSSRRIRTLFEKFGDTDYIGEDTSITEHCLQAAAAALKAGESEEDALACLLHDIGHLCGLEAGAPPGMDGCGTPDHEGLGAQFLAELGFPEAVSHLCAEHVNAKRFLCATDPSYMERLSEASKTTLRFQGGPMSADEVARARSDPCWPLVLRMRTYDEAGKDPESGHITLDSFDEVLRTSLRESVRAQLSRLLLPESAATDIGCTARYGSLSPFAATYVLSPEQVRLWAENGYVVVRGALDPVTTRSLSDMTHRVAEMDGPLVHHEVAADEQVRLCRVENFCYRDPTAWGKVAFGVAQDIASQAFGEEAVLFKDKINFKGPRGAGFLAQQDATAYATDELAKSHISIRIAIDPSTEHNGPLEVAAGWHRQGILPHSQGVIVEETAQGIVFEPVLVDPGDLVLFDSYVPHRSASNLSDTWRRSAYLTFNRAAEGDLHKAYYAKKAAAWAAGAAGSISINNDFAGNVLTPAAEQQRQQQLRSEYGNSPLHL